MCSYPGNDTWIRSTPESGCGVTKRSDFPGTGMRCGAICNCSRSWRRRMSLMIFLSGGNTWSCVVISSRFKMPASDELFSPVKGLVANPVVMPTGLAPVSSASKMNRRAILYSVPNFGHFAMRSGDEVADGGSAGQRLPISASLILVSSGERIFMSLSTPSRAFSSVSPPKSV